MTDSAELKIVLTDETPTLTMAQQAQRDSPPDPSWHPPEAAENVPQSAFQAQFRQLKQTADLRAAVEADNARLARVDPTDPVEDDKTNKLIRKVMATVAVTAGARAGLTAAVYGGAEAGIGAGLVAGAGMIPGPIGMVAQGIGAAGQAMSLAMELAAKKITVASEGMAQNIIGQNDVLGALIREEELRLENFKKSDVFGIGRGAQMLAGRNDEAQLAEVKGFRAVSQAFEGLSEKLAQFSPELAQATAQRDIQRTMLDVGQAGRQGPALAELRNLTTAFQRMERELAEKAQDIPGQIAKQTALNEAKLRELADAETKADQDAIRQQKHFPEEPWWSSKESIVQRKIQERIAAAIEAIRDRQKKEAEEAVVNLDRMVANLAAPWDNPIRLEFDPARNANLSELASPLMRRDF